MNLVNVIDNSKSNGVRDLSTVTYIVVHYLGVRGQNNSPWIGSSGEWTGAHFFVYWDGTIYQALEVNQLVWHCGGAVYDSQPHPVYGICTNYNSIGIEMCPLTANGEYEPSAEYEGWYFEKATEDACIELVKHLMSTYNIPADHVVRHHDCTGKWCPAPYCNNNKYNGNYTWDEFKQRLGGVSPSSDTPSATPTSSPTSSPTTVDPRNVFVDELAKHVGKDGHDWVMSQCNINRSDKWNSYTMCATAKAVGYDNKIMPDKERDPAEFARKVVETYGGTYISGMESSSSPSPDVGDFAVFQNQNQRGKKDNKYLGNRIAVVKKVDGASLETLEGDVGSTLPYASEISKKNENIKSVAWFARPNWSKVGGSQLPSNATQPIQWSLYETSSTRSDATLREVCYWDESDSDYSLDPTNTRVSVINYTGLLADILGLVVPTLAPATYTPTSYPTSYTGTDDISGVEPPACREIIQFLINNGFNTAQAVGIAANIKQESGFRCDAYDGTQAWGLAQWQGSRLQAMIAYVGSDWKNNLTGQMEFLLTEMKDYSANSWYGCANEILQCPNTLEGAKQACEIFLRKFEQPGNYGYEVPHRNSYVEEIWSMVKIGVSQPGTTPASGAGQSLTNNGDEIINQLSVVAEHVIPPESQLGASQSGLIGDMSPYDRMNMKWYQGVVQGIWRAQGCPTRDNLATIDNLFLVAVVPMLGNPGDVLRIVLEDNTAINCVVGDVKGSDKQHEYGHIFSGMVSIVEWEVCNSPRDGSGMGQFVNEILQRLGIYKKKVSKVINYGNKYAVGRDY